MSPRAFYIVPMAILLAIDAPAWIRRSVHSRARMDPRELVLNTLRVLLGKFRPTHVLAAMDGPRSELVRRELLPKYKAHRKPLADDLRAEIDRCEAFVRDIGICTVQVPRWEADDILATVAHLCAGSKCEVIIASPDKDLAQCVNDRVSLWNGNKLLDEAAILDKWGVPPKLVPDVQAIAGDTADGIPGARGIGIKIASKLVAHYGSARDVVEARAELTPAKCEALGAFDLDASLELVRLRTDLALPVTGRDMRWRGTREDAIARHLD